MKLLFKLAWRNVWRNKRRSIITILAVTFAVMLSIAMRGLQLGTYEVNIRHAVELFTGHLQLQLEGYQKNPSLQKSFFPPPGLQGLLDNASGVVAWTPRAVGDGLASFRENSVGAVIVGIVPQTEARVSTLSTRVVEGRYLESDTTLDAVVGYKMLENLKAGIGDEIVILAQGYDGSLGNLRFRVTGALKTGSAEIDGGLVLIGLSTAQELLALYGRIHTMAIRLNDLEQIPPVKAFLRRSLQSPSLTVLDWSEVMPELKQFIEFDNISGILTLGILIVVVAFGITNTVLMSVTERFREFGVVLSLGMPQTRLVALVFVETMVIVAIGLLLGNLFAFGINYYIVENPIVFTGDFEEIYREYGFLPRLESTIRLSMFFNSTASMFLVALASALYPLLKVFRLEPLKGIRYT